MADTPDIYGLNVTGEPGRRDIFVSGWDRPLNVDWDFQLEVLREEIISAAPGSSGALKSAFREPDAVTINAQQDEITITVQPPHPASAYALAMDQGADVPAYTAPKHHLPYKNRSLYQPGVSKWATGVFKFSNTGGARAYGEYAWMMSAVIGGVRRFFKHRRAFHIEGKNYVEKGVRGWIAELMAVNPQPDGSTGSFIEWGEGYAGAHFGERHGIVSR